MVEWYPKAIRLDGPAEKQGYAGITTRQGKGLIAHSAEGSFNAAIGVLCGSVQSSWHLFNRKDGTLYQHYPLSAVTWHGGCVFANAHFVGVECEGRAGEPLTQAQVASLAELIAWLADQEGWPSIERRVTLWEHREMVEYGADPTACPSDRIPWEEVIKLATDTVNVLKMLMHLAALALKGDLQDLANALKWLGVTPQQS